MDDAEPEPRRVDTQGHRSDRQIQLDNPNGYQEAGARKLRPWLEELVRELVGNPTATLAVRFVSDREMARLNHRFRGLDGPTDILTFAGDETIDGTHLGDIAVSIPSARRQALERGHPVEKELRILLLHGVLHCLGYDHEKDEGEMDRLEKRLRRRWVGI